MNGRRISKLVHEGTYVAEVDVETIFTEDGWSPYLSVEDAYKLDDVHAYVHVAIAQCPRNAGSPIGDRELPAIARMRQWTLAHAHRVFPTMPPVRR